MSQNYTNAPLYAGQSTTLQGNKGLLILLAFFSLTFTAYTVFKTVNLAKVDIPSPVSAPETRPTFNKATFDYFGTDSVATVVEKALYFKSLLDATNIYFRANLHCLSCPQVEQFALWLRLPQRNSIRYVNCRCRSI